MKTGVIYHEAVSKLVFMKISFIIKIIVHHQTFCYLLILSFIVEVVIAVKILSYTVKIIVYHGNYSY